MYKLLIIDDEPIIRQGLRTIIDWGHYDIAICGEADNGIDGLRLCQELKPEFIIVDIKMPGMNGLEIIEEAKRIGIESDFIVLSGYSEFAFAQKTTEFGVRSYLLKPIEQRDLIKVVEMLQKEWNNRLKEREDMKQSLHLKAEYELQRMFQSVTIPSTDLQDSYNLLAKHLDLPWPAYQVLLLSDERRELESEEVLWLLSRLKMEMQKDSRGAVFTYRQYVAVLSEHSDSLNLLMEWLAEAEMRFNLHLVVAQGIRVTEFHQIPESFRNTLEMMRDKFFSERNERIIVRGVYSRQKCLEPVMFNLEHFAEEAAQCVASGNTDRLVQIVTDMEQAMLHHSWDEQQIKAGFVAVYRDIVRILSGIDEQFKSVCPPFHAVVQGVENQTTLKSVHAFVEQQLFSITTLWVKGRRSGSFQSILDHISEHFCSDLKLEGLAEIFHYNSSYLGKLFKTQTGETFNNYLDRIRMEKAKQLLAGGAKVYEVASIVGYASVDYFHLKFKKMEGQSPSAYRDQWTM